MPNKKADITVAHQVEFAINQFERISLLPSVANEFLKDMFRSDDGGAAIAEVIESDPCLLAGVFALSGSKKRLSRGSNLSVSEILGKYSSSDIQKFFFSYEIDSSGIGRALPKEQLIKHSLAVGISAEMIAGQISPAMDRKLAYFAGLLHNIGVLALYDMMPKSYDNIIAQARGYNCDLASMEQKYLGIDHTIIGKRLAGRWSLPKQISWATWLYNKNTDVISRAVPQARIAEIVSLAYSIARFVGIGDSGSYGEVVLPENVIAALGLDNSQVEQIVNALGEKVEAVFEKLGFANHNSGNDYLNRLSKTASRLTDQNIILGENKSELARDAKLWEFARGFILRENCQESVVEVASDMAVSFQNYYHSGAVCIYLLPTDHSQVLDVAVAEEGNKSQIVVVDMPEFSPAVPAEIFRQFGLSSAVENCDWLFDQLDVEFDRDSTIIVPLIAGSRAIGAVAFEQRYQVESEKLFESLEVTSSVAAAILKNKMELNSQRMFSEQFVELAADGEKPVAAESAPVDVNINKPVAKVDDFSGLVEMAAGAAHELNNPLSVISGRAQLLSESETDSDKLESLKKIENSSQFLSQIISDLLSFAEPREPSISEVAANQVVEEAIQLVMMKKEIDLSDFKIINELEGRKLIVDSAQISSAIANILHNAIEAYSDGIRDIDIYIGPSESQSKAIISIADHGSGMDEDTVAKATHPFFSNKPAGRQRGMGLANARRLIELNGGTLSIDSMAGQGTTVVIELGCK